MKGGGGGLEGGRSLWLGVFIGGVLMEGREGDVRHMCVTLLYRSTE